MNVSNPLASLKEKCTRPLVQCSIGADVPRLVTKLEIREGDTVILSAADILKENTSRAALVDLIQITFLTLAKFASTLAYLANQYIQMLETR